MHIDSKLTSALRNTTNKIKKSTYLDYGFILYIIKITSTHTAGHYNNIYKSVNILTFLNSLNLKYLCITSIQTKPSLRKDKSITKAES